MDTSRNGRKNSDDVLGGGLVPSSHAPVGPFDPALASYGPVGGPETTAPVARLHLARLLRFKWTILVVFAVIAGPAITGIWTLMVPSYTAKAEVRVRPIIPRLVFKTEENGMIPLYQSYMNTQVSVMLSAPVLNRVLDQPDVQATEWFRQPSELLSSSLNQARTPMERLRDALSIRPRASTEVIDVAMTTTNRSDVAVIVNAVLNQYLKYVSDTSDQTSERLYLKLTEQRDLLKAEIATHEVVQAGLRKEYHSVSLDELATRMRTRLETAEEQLQTLRRDISVAEWQEKELAALTQEKAATSGNAAPASAQTATPAEVSPAAAGAASAAQAAKGPEYFADLEWRRLHINAEAARLDLELAKERLQQAHPKLAELRKRVEFTEGLLQQRQAQLDQEWKTRPLNTPAAVAQRPQPQALNAPQLAGLASDLEELRRKIKRLRYQEQLLDQECATARGNLADLFSKTQVLAQGSDVIRDKKEMYSAVRSRLDEKEIERKAPASIEPLSEALPPSQASSDRRFLLTGLALLAGLGAGIAVAFVRVGMSQDIHDADDLLSNGRTPFLGELPNVARQHRADPEDDPRLFESIRMLRTALLNRIESGHGNVIQITSATPRAGKTTVAALLAKSLAQCGKEVLLVDADLRNPRLASQFGVGIEPGLIGSLADQAPDVQTIMQLGTPHLSFLPAGKFRSDADAELMANGRFASSLDRWRQQYDVVLLDTSPLLPVADARIVARQVAGTIVVAREGNCHRVDVLNALSCLSIAGGELLGIVFIGSSRRSGYPSYYAYSASSVGANGESDKHVPSSHGV